MCFKENYVTTGISLSLQLLNLSSWATFHSIECRLINVFTSNFLGHSDTQSLVHITESYSIFSFYVTAIIFQIILFQLVRYIFNRNEG